MSTKNCATFDLQIIVIQFLDLPQLFSAPKYISAICSHPRVIIGMTAGGLTEWRCIRLTIASLRPRNFSLDFTGIYRYRCLYIGANSSLWLASFVTLPYEI